MRFSSVLGSFWLIIAMGFFFQVMAITLPVGISSTHLSTLLLRNNSNSFLSPYISSTSPNTAHNIFLSHPLLFHFPLRTLMKITHREETIPNKLTETFKQLTSHYERFHLPCQSAFSCNFSDLNIKLLTMSSLPFLNLKHHSKPPTLKTLVTLLLSCAFVYLIVVQFLFLPSRESAHISISKAYNKIGCGGFNRRPIKLF